MHEYKSVLRDVAARARNVILAQTDLPETRDCILATCSRTILCNDVDRARFLINSYPIAADNIIIRANKVCMKNPEQFSMQISSARHSTLSHQVQHIETQSARPELSQTRRNKLRGRMSFLAGVMRQW
eukprot:738484-Karenia_brevis.AAC.1